MKKRVLLLISGMILLIATITLILFLPKKRIELVSFPEGIRIINKEAYYDFFKNQDFTKIDIEIFLPYKDKRIKKTETDKEKIKELWTFIRDSKDPYIREAGSNDIYIYLYFYKRNGKKYYVDIFKNYNDDLSFFVFGVSQSFEPGTFFSCFDKKGFVDKLIKRYVQ